MITNNPSKEGLAKKVPWECVRPFRRDVNLYREIVEWTPQDSKEPIGYLLIGNHPDDNDFILI